MQRSARAAFYIFAAILLLTGCGSPAPQVPGGEPDIRRLTREQYERIIADVFGEGVRVGGRFDPLVRTDGLLALGARSARITPAGFEQYYQLAASIAEQVVSERYRADLIPCTPAAPSAADDACAREFFSRVGRYLYRRPLIEEELATSVKAAHEAAEGVQDFYEGVGVALAAMLTTPQFLFVIDTVEPDPDEPGEVRLTAFAKATRLSFLLWNTAPDDLLLQAAEQGELHSHRGLERQVDRMLASPRAADGVRAFFKDMLEFELFETLEKDPTIYPAFSQALADDAMEQTLRMIVDLLIVRDQDYRDLFTTRNTFLTPSLARVYRIPFESPAGGWAPYTFPKDDPRVGILTQVGFTAMHSHPGRSSATLRGKALRETLLCQTVPPPPGNVDFTLFNDPNAPSKTARQRLTAHATVSACTGCHLITDPIGLGLENFDGIGAFRNTENGVELDVAGALDGATFSNPAELARAVHDNPAAPSCLVKRLTAYGMGRPLTREDAEFMAYVQEAFAEDDYRFEKLLRRLALSDALYAVRKPVEQPDPQTLTTSGERSRPSDEESTS